MKKMVKKLMILLILLSFLNLQVYAVELKCKSAVLIDANTGKILYEKNKDEKLPIASLTKLMTYYTFIENTNDSPINNFVYEIDNSKYKKNEPILNLEYGEEINLEEALKAMFVFSANNVAELLQQTYEQKKNTDFIDAMNGMARSLGLKNTNYVNATGLTEDEDYNLSTAVEQGILAYNILNKHKNILKYTSLKTFTYKNKVFYSTNKLLGKVEGLDGLKTGYTKKAGYCFIGTVDRTATNGHNEPFRFITVVLGCKTDKDRFEETKKLINYGVDNFENYVISKDIEFKEINKKYKGNYLYGSLSENAYIIKSKQENVDVKFEPLSKLPRKIKKGDKIGTLKLKSSIDEKVVDVFATQEVKKKNIFQLILQYIVEKLMG